MRSISGLGLGLSLVFGCLLLALIAELYYLLCWKKKIMSKIDENGGQIPQQTSHFLTIFCCWKNPTSNSQQLCSSPSLVYHPHSSSNSNKDMWMKQEINNFPRFLFTITEETREDLESDDGGGGGGVGGFKNRIHSSNVSDLLQVLETPFLTPMASPPYFTPPLTPSFSDHHHQHSFESELDQDAEFNRLRCSPPPKFKFLRDAEEKLMMRRTAMENEEDGQFITLNIVAENQEDHGDGISHNFYSSSSPPTLQHQIQTPHVKFNVC